jgi:CBS domain-containing protein
MSMKSESRRVKHQILEQLTSLRDEGKVQLHLLSLDARQHWSELEKQVSELESAADRGGEKATELLKQTAHELTRSLNEFMAKHMNHSVGLLTSARTLMSSHVRACGPDDSLSEAAQLMWNGDCGAIPVVADAKVIGMLTDRDICMATFTQGKAPAELLVKSAMSKELFSCAADESIGSVLSIMGNRRVRRVPVVSHAAELLGMLSLADIARWAKPLANPAVDAAITDALSLISAHVPQKLHSVAK